MKFALVSAVSLFAASASAQDLDTMQIALDLGTLLAAEQKCGLTYDQVAIEAFIDAKVDPGNMSFASDLSMMTSGAKMQLVQMDGSAITAHCRAVSRSAKHFGFIK
ncbi:hypothetical protein [Albidovulum sp.]|uniref:hypothetical protein n=1 Tax=Albidovulum sp. TaxID=1872424 RepID=UPI0039B8E711